MSDKFSLFFSKIKDFLNHVLTRGSTHDDLGAVTAAEAIVSLGFGHLIVVFSLGIDSIKIGVLSFALKLKSSILRFCFFVIGFGINTHNSNLLFSIDGKFLSCGFSFIAKCDSLGLNLIDDNSLLTFSFGDQDRSFFFGIDNGRSFFSVSFNLILFFIC